MNIDVCEIIPEDDKEIVNCKKNHQSIQEQVEQPTIQTNKQTEQINDVSNELTPLSENSTYCIKKNFDLKDQNIQEVNDLSLTLKNQKLQELEACMNVESSETHFEEISIEKTIEESKTDNEVSMVNESIENEEHAQLTYDWTNPKLIIKAVEDFKPTESYENFTKGCQWAPDGTCILVASEDFKFRIFDIPRELYGGNLPKDYSTLALNSTLKVKEGGTIYDYSWFPYMNSWEPSTCCFLSTSQGSPIHLWDAFTGQLRATYRAYNQVDEVEAAISVQFTDNGSQIWSGFKNALRSFDTNQPGRQTSTIYLKKDFPNVSGIVSCIKENPSMAGLIAFGTYSKNIGLYKDGPLCSFQTGNGVTQIEFSPCGTKLYSCVRRSGEFLCWDLRNPGTVLYSLQDRQSNTNQRIHFSISYNGEEVVSGGTDGAVRVWKIPNEMQVEENLNPAYKMQVTKDCINGVQLHKNLPILAISTGSRICDEEIFEHRDNSLRFYWFEGR